MNSLQFLYYMKGMLTLDLGYSFRDNMPVISLMSRGSGRRCS